MNTINFFCDVLIIGSGVAGLSLAIRLAPSRQKIIVLSKGSIRESSTLYAQGGIAVAIDEKDSVDSHVEDTIIAGAGIVDKRVAEFVAKNAKHCMEWLINQGVFFDTYIQKNGKQSYHLVHEGGHSHRRVLHIADTTGRVIETKLINKVISYPNVQIIEYSNTIDLILSDKIGLQGTRRVIGALTWSYSKKKIESFLAHLVVLATGGASRVYQYTTNPYTSSGDGIAMAWRAGCRIANLEFNQFHPTALFHPKARNFLLTEALRGEGAYLRRPDGSRFMPDFDARNELASRDIVTRAIDHEMKRLSVDCMYLDITHKSSEFIRQHFPMIYERLTILGIDLARDLVPIVPAAHYTCGGIVVDDHGLTDIDGLYAIGEVSYTGLHGANRIASNSLLECLVYSWSAAEDILKRAPYNLHQSEKSTICKERGIENSEEQDMIIQHRSYELRSLMWNCAGITRTKEKLESALCRIVVIKKEVDDYYTRFNFSNRLLELRNLIQVAELVVRCAIMRKESRGLHYIIDYPEQLAISGPSVLSPYDIDV